MRFDCLATAATGTNWQSPGNALSLGSGFAEYLASTTGQSPLTLSGFSSLPPATHQVSGVEVLLLVGNSQAYGALGRFATGIYQASLGQVGGDAASTHDANSGTWLSADAELTVIHDLGSAKLVHSVVLEWWNSSGLDYYERLEYSSDGAGWTQVTLGATSVGGGAAILNTQTIAVGVSARYWRWSQRNNLIVVGSTDNTRCVEFRLVGSVGSPYDLEVALSLDGASPASAWRTIGGQNADFTTSLGGQYDDWGVDWSATLGASFGLLVRRKSAPGRAGAVRIDYSAVSLWASVERSMSRLTNLQRVAFGVQADFATPAASLPRQSNAILLDFNPEHETSSTRLRGDTAHGPSVTHREWCTGSAGGTFDFSEFGFVPAGSIGKWTDEQLVAGVHRHTVFYRPREARDLQFLSCAYGDEANAERYDSVAFPTFNVSGDGQSVGFSGQLIGKALQALAGIPAGANAVQRFTLAGAPTGGSFKLSFQGKESAAINVAGLNAAAIAAALNGLSTIGAGGVAVTGAGPYDITFSGGAVAGQEQQLIEVTVVAALTGGVTPSLQMAVVATGGQALMVPVPISAADVRHEIGDVGGAMTAVAMPFDYEVGFASMFNPVFASNKTLGNSIAKFADSQSDVSATIALEADNVAAGLYNDFKAKTPKVYRLIIEGPQIGATAYNYALMIEIVGQIVDHTPIEDSQGIVARSFKFNAMYNQSLGYAAKVVLINTVQTYTS